MTSLDALEHTVYEEGTEEALRAYADALKAEDHPLGRLIEMELAADIDPQDRALHRSHPEIAKLRDEIINPHHQPGAPRTKLKPRVLNIMWRDGLVVAKSLNDARKDAAAQLQVLLDNRAGRALRHLRLYHSKKSCNYKAILQAAVEAGTPNLRVIDISQSGSAGFEGLKGLNERAPRLEELHIRGKISAGGLKALSSAWPNLHTLMVDFDLTPVWKKPQSGKKLAKLFAKGALPKLRWLRLERTGLDDTLLELIRASEVMEHLELLNVGGFFTESAVSALLDEVPASCPCLITRYAPRDDHQTVVEVVYRGVHPEQDEDYAALWTPLAAVDWWEGGHSFYGAEVKVDGTKVSSTLPDGTLHGRQTQWRVINGAVADRVDQMFWYGVKHGRVRIQTYHGVKHQRFVNGLRDEPEALTESDATTGPAWIFAQGVKVEPEDHGITREAELRRRFGSEFTTEENPRYTLGPARELSPEELALPQVAAHINTTDDGMRAYTMNLADGDTAQVVLWTQGDTTCGVIVSGAEVVGEIEDLGIRLASTAK